MTMTRKYLKRQSLSNAEVIGVDVIAEINDMEADGYDVIALLDLGREVLVTYDSE